MGLFKEIIDENNNKHIVGFELEEDGILYVVTIDKMIFKKENNKFKICLKENTNEEIYNMLQKIIAAPDGDVVI